MFDENWFKQIMWYFIGIGVFIGVATSILTDLIKHFVLPHLHILWK